MEATPAAQGRGHGPLLLLPAEIRNTIYTYVFAETARLDQFGAIVDPDCARPFTSYDFALVNRQIHNETKEMYYEAQLGRECFTKPHSSYISALKMYRSLSKPLQARMQSLEFFCRPISDPEWFTHTLKGAPGLLSNGKGADWQRVYEELTAASYKDHKTSNMTYWTRKCILLRRTR